MNKRVSFGVHVKGLHESIVNALSGLRRVRRREWGLKGRTRALAWRGCNIRMQEG